MKHYIITGILYIVILFVLVFIGRQDGATANRNVCFKNGGNAFLEFSDRTTACSYPRGVK